MTVRSVNIPAAASHVAAVVASRGLPRQSKLTLSPAGIAEKEALLLLII